MSFENLFLLLPEIIIFLPYFFKRQANAYYMFGILPNCTHLKTTKVFLLFF